MISPDQIHSILDAGTLAEQLNLRVIDSRDLREVLSGTPDGLTDIVHYALLWGIGDDVLRSRLVKSAAEPLRRNLKWVVDQYDDALDEWLAGPEASSERPTQAYIAFSNMRMGSDEIF